VIALDLCFYRNNAAMRTTSSIADIGGGWVREHRSAAACPAKNYWRRPTP